MGGRGVRSYKRLSGISVRDVEDAVPYKTERSPREMKRRGRQKALSFRTAPLNV